MTRFFICFFFLGGGRLFLVSVFLFFCFVKRPQRVFLPAIEGFLYFVPPQRPVIKSFFFPRLFFSFVFLLYSLSKSHFCFCPSTPSWKNLFFGLFRFCFAFSFGNVCLFIETHFLNVPFKPKLFPYLTIYLFVLFLFLFSWCMFLPFGLFGFVFDMCLICFLLFLFCFLICFQNKKYTDFLVNLVF